MACRNLWYAALASTFLNGCAVTSSIPSSHAGADLADKPIIGLSSETARASSDLLNYQAERGGGYVEEDLIAKSVRDAGRRLGATAGYRDQAEFLYDYMQPYDEYLSKIFDFQELMLPDGIVPPVLGQTRDTVTYRQTENGSQSKEIRAIVLTTIKDATFANPRAPSWRDYLQLTRPSLDKPLPQLQPEIDANRSAWKRGVEEGYARGIEQATQAFEISINKLSRDYTGMQLFRILWLTKQAEPPQIVDQSQNVVGGGKGNREMSIGVRRIVISEPVYFVNDSAEWDAIISTAFDEEGERSAGLMDIVKDIDNTQHSQPPAMEPNLNAR